MRTTCNFCGVGCQLDLNVDREANEGRGEPQDQPARRPGTTLNDGNLCVKGRFAYEFIHHDERLTQPLVRGEDGELHPATWEEALERVAAGLKGVQRRHGADALGFVVVQPLHRRGELPDAEAVPGRVRDQQLSISAPRHDTLQRSPVW